MVEQDPRRRRDICLRCSRRLRRGLDGIRRKAEFLDKNEGSFRPAVLSSFPRITLETLPSTIETGLAKSRSVRRYTNERTGSLYPAASANSLARGMPQLKIALAIWWFRPTPPKNNCRPKYATSTERKAKKNSGIRFWLELTRVLSLRRTRRPSRK